MNTFVDDEVGDGIIKHLVSDGSVEASGLITNANIELKIFDDETLPARRSSAKKDVGILQHADVVLVVARVRVVKILVDEVDAGGAGLLGEGDDGVIGVDVIGEEGERLLVVFALMLMMEVVF